MEKVLGVLIGGILGLVLLVFIIWPLLERYSDNMFNWYEKYLDKWRKK